NNWHARRITDELEIAFVKPTGTGSQPFSAPNVVKVLADSGGRVINTANQTPVPVWTTLVTPKPAPAPLTSTFERLKAESFESRINRQPTIKAKANAFLEYKFRDGGEFLKSEVGQA